MGYDEFLKKNPQFHHKFLLSMAKEQLPQERPTVEVNISWLSNDRLAYKQGALVGNVEDVAFRAPSSVLCAPPSSVALSTEDRVRSQAAPSATPFVLPDHRPTSAKRADEFLNQAWKAEPEDKGLAAILRHPDKP